MKILVPVDGSAFSRRLLAWLAAHEEWVQGGHAFTLLFVNQPVPPRPASVLDKSVLTAHYADTAERVFKPIRRFFAKQSVAARYETLVGPVAETIAKTAEKGGYDLVMIGSHGHGALLNLVLGSVATKVLAGCKVPVLVIR